MKLPFFKSDKSETKKIPPPAAPPARSNTPTGQHAPVHPADMSETRPLFQPAKSNGTGVEIPLSCFQSQLPAQIFTLAAQTQIATLTVNLPQDRILPQLKTGRVTILLDELIRFLPNHLLRQPQPTINGQQAIKVTLRQLGVKQASGSPVRLIIDQYQFAKGGKLAVIDLATTGAVRRANTDDYQKIIQSFRWL